MLSPSTAPRRPQPRASRATNGVEASRIAAMATPARRPDWKGARPPPAGLAGSGLMPSVASRGGDHSAPAGTYGLPPFVSQKISAIRATWASSSAAAPASTPCLHVPACLSAFQKRPCSSGYLSKCSGLK